MSARVSVSPLSPARAWASSCSLRFTILLQDSDGRPYARALEQRRHDADALVGRLAEAAPARGPVGAEGPDLSADALGENARGSARGDAQAHLVGGLRVAEVGAVRAVDADEIDAQVGDVLAQALAHDLAGELRTLFRLCTGVGHLTFADEARSVADADFVCWRSRPAFAALDRQSVRTGLLQCNGGKICDDVGRDVAAGIGHLVQELLLGRAHGDRAAGTGDLAEHAVAFRVDVAPRKSEMREVGDVLQPGLGEITARDLPGALEKVADRRGAPESFPVVQPPAEGMRDRRDKERR